jgi:hypothetical protein
VEEAIALLELDAACRDCGKRFRATPVRSFLRFQKFKCPACSKSVLYPLTRGYRITYWVLTVLMIVTVINNLTTGSLSVPGGLGIAVIFGLVKDRKIRVEVLRSTMPVSK